MDFQLLNTTKLANMPDVTGRTWHETVERDTATDTISIDVAGEIDAQWLNDGMPHDGLRIYGLRRTGNRTMTFLGAPGQNGSAPCYVLSNGRYLHLSGPTLADWQRTQDEAEFMAQWQEARREARELYEFASGR